MQTTLSVPVVVLGVIAGRVVLALITTPQGLLELAEEVEVEVTQ
jgi:hypothetical protein